MKVTERVYLQYRPNQSSLKTLLEWQQQAVALNPQARPVSSDRMHLTLIHFGIIAEMFEELRLVNSELTWEQYDSNLRKFINDSQAELPRETEVVTEGLQRYGSKASVLAVKVQPSTALTAAHEHSLEQLKEFLHACGIEHTTAYLQSNRNLQFARTFNPHITLLRAARVSDIELPPAKLKLELMPLRYR